MRALILLFSAIVLVLAALIVYPNLAGGATGPERSAGPTFDAMRLIADAQAGESATYRDEAGDTWTFKVERSVPGGVDRPPQIRLWSIRKDRKGHPLPGGTEVYTHRPTRHGFCPLMAPGDVDGYDRVWVWDRIRREARPWQGKPRELWRVDLIDPALPEAGGADHVVAWFDPGVPVFGLVSWQRRGRTWDLVDWSPR